MSRLLLGAFLILSAVTWSQTRSQLWLGIGLKRDIGKHWVAGIQTNARWRTDGALQTLFQEASLKSEHLKWFRPSVDYRFITSYAPNGNPLYSNRVNFNFDFRSKYKDFKYGTRIRYQLFIGGRYTSGSDLDPSIRIKPYISYSIPKKRLQPELSAEWFYNPVYEENGQCFNRFRVGLTGNIDLPGPNELSLTYYYGKKFNTGSPYTEHIFSLEYSFEWRKKADKTEEPKGKSSSMRNL